MSRHGDDEAATLRPGDEPEPGRFLSTVLLLDGPPAAGVPPRPDYVRFKNLSSRPRPGNNSSAAFSQYATAKFGVADGLEAHELLARLALRMQRPNGEADPADTLAGGVPAGYTYLGQLIAHDMSFANEKWPSLEPAGVDAYVGLRETQLTLEMIYGQGPQAFPLGYSDRDAERQHGLGRTRLRTGSLRPSDDPLSDLPNTDLPRIACPHLNDDIGNVASRADLAETLVNAAMARVPYGHVMGLESESRREIFRQVLAPMTSRLLCPPDVLVADPRNDSHSIVAQMTVLLHRLHNNVCDRLETDDLKGEKLFRRARALCVHVWRTIVWNDYLRTLLDPDVFERYAPRPTEPKRTVRFRWRKPPGRMPVEFTHAVFRFGHAMARDRYDFGDDDFFLPQILAASSSAHYGTLPSDRNWLIRWSRFFATAAQSPQPARPLQPDLPDIHRASGSGLSDTARKAAAAVAKQPQGADPGLAYRDLLRQVSVPMASVQALLDEMRADPTLKRIADRYALTGDDKTRPDEMMKWFAESPNLLEADETTFFANQPPLQLFALVEARECFREDVAGNRKPPYWRLGPLGSFIVAETIFGALAEFHPGGPDADGGYTAEYPAASPETVADAATVFNAPPPSTMAGLIAWLGPH